VFNPIASESQWSFGWQGNTKDVVNKPNSSKSMNNTHTGFNLYHNQSSIVLGDTNKGGEWKGDSSKPADMKKTNPMADRPVWNYDPKKAGKTTMILGTEKTDYRKKDEVCKERTPTTLTNSRRK
jgi:hypothetical protein